MEEKVKKVYVVGGAIYFPLKKLFIHQGISEDLLHKEKTDE